MKMCIIIHITLVLSYPRAHFLRGYFREETAITYGNKLESEQVRLTFHFPLFGLRELVLHGRDSGAILCLSS